MCITTATQHNTNLTEVQRPVKVLCFFRINREKINNFIIKKNKKKTKSVAIQKSFI